MKKTLSAATIAVTLVMLGACGGSDRPSVSDVSKAIKKADSSYTQKQADCAAKALVDSDLSDKGLKAIADNDKNFKPSAADKKVEATVTPTIEKCFA